MRRALYRERVFVVLSAGGSDMRRRRVQSKRLNKTVAAIRRKRKLTTMKRKVSSRNRVFVHLVNH